MSQVLDDLVNLLTLEPIEENLFRGSSQDLGFRQLFGGQVLGQSLSAMSQTVEDARHVHSMHGYFLRPGDASLPVVYQVDLKDPRVFLGAQNFPMKNKDVVYVANAPAAELQKFLNILSSTVFSIRGLTDLGQ